LFLVSNTILAIRVCGGRHFCASHLHTTPGETGSRWVTSYKRTWVMKCWSSGTLVMVDLFFCYIRSLHLFLRIQRLFFGAANPASVVRSHTLLSRICILSFGVCTEFCTWTLLMMAGLIWIHSARFANDLKTLLLLC